MPQNPAPSTLFVTRIIAGDGITIDHDAGTGIVTVTAQQGPSDDVEITGGTIDGTPIGGTVPAAGAFTALQAASITGTDASLDIKGQDGQTTNAAGGVVPVKGGAGNGTGAGGAASLIGGDSGAGATGDGGPSRVTGGAALSTNGNGGSAVITGGAKAGSGIAGGIRNESIVLSQQPAPAAKTTSATLTAAEVLARIITVNQGAAGASALQLPLATDLQAALPADIAANDSFDFSLINVSTVAAEAASLTTNTGWTLVGDMDVAANSAITTKSAGRFRARFTGAGAFTLYRLS